MGESRRGGVAGPAARRSAGALSGLCQRGAPGAGARLPAVRGAPGVQPRAGKGGQAGLLALVHGGLGDRHLPPQRPGRRGLGGRRAPAGGSRAGHRWPGNRAARPLKASPTGAERVPMSRKPDPRVHAALRRIGPLPVLGGTVSRIKALADNPHTTTGDLAQVVESDESFSANLLRYANSAANARPIRARTIRQAITLLGRRALVRKALEAETYRFLERFPGGAHLSRGQLHVHAVSVAAYSMTAAELTGAQVDTAHLAGLLHDVGKLLMPAAFGIEAVEQGALESRAGAERPALERRVLGLDHAAAGGLLVGLSDPADEVVRAISYHHGGPTGLAVPSAEAACVIVGDAVAHLLSGNEIDRDLLGVALEKLGAA